MDTKTHEQTVPSETSLENLLAIEEHLNEAIAMLQPFKKKLENEAIMRGASIDTLDLPSSTKAALNRNGIFKIDQLLTIGTRHLLAFNNFGPKRVQKIVDALAAVGLAF